MSVTITWDAEAGPVVRPLFESVLLHHLPRIAPPWCREVLIGYEDKHEGNSALYVTGHPEYRWARITVCPSSLSLDITAREKHLVHELFHLPLEGMHHEHSVVKGFVPERMIGYVDEQWRRAWEGAVCDLTEAYLALNAMPADG